MCLEVRRIINNERGKIKKRIIKFTKRCEKSIETQPGIVNSYKRKLVRENKW